VLHNLVFLPDWDARKIGCLNQVFQSVGSAIKV
jgi:hypothetical protein